MGRAYCPKTENGPLWLRCEDGVGINAGIRIVHVVFFLSIAERLREDKRSQIRRTFFFSEKGSNFCPSSSGERTLAAVFSRPTIARCDEGPILGTSGFEARRQLVIEHRSLPLLRAREKGPQECGTYSFVFWGL
jgi:hypothetical protein